MNLHLLSNYCGLSLQLVDSSDPHTCRAIKGLGLALSTLLSIDYSINKQFLALNSSGINSAQAQ